MNHIRNLSIARRLAIAFGFAVLMLVGQCALGIVGLSQTQSLLKTTVSDARNRYDLALEANEASMNEELHMRRMAVLFDSTQIASEEKLVVLAGSTFEKAVDNLIHQALSPDDRKAIEDIDNLQKQAAPIRRKVLELSKNMQTDQANTVYEQELDPISSRIRTASSKFAEHQKTFVEDSFQEISTLSMQLRYTAFMSAVLGALAATAAGVMLYISISHPLNEAVLVADKIALGDLTYEIVSSERNEIGELMRALSSMSRKMSGAISTIGQASESVHQASNEIASGNLDLSQRTERQAIAVQMATKSIHDISSGVTSNAESSRTAKTQAQSAAEVATQGGSRIGQLIHTMDDISKSSKRISEIVGVIDSIAFQTNILALNAAVEAARAGDQGRGFAVVASEVRTLAQRSSQAAKEITELIQANVATVSIGVTQVGLAGDTMRSIVQSSEKVAIAITNISVASDHQAESIVHIHQAVTEIDAAIGQNAALVEQATAAADSLQIQAVNLNREISQFRVVPA
jgi:methyl-accepting chemotaxis protein